MAKDRTPILKRCRYLGISPAVLGSTKKPSTRHQASGKRPPKVSEYGLQLKEKQKAKYIYGIMEKQLRRLYIKARQQEGLTGENLLQMLELRLDNIVFRLGFTRTRAEAQQFVSHGHVLVNGKRVDIRSTRLKVGDVVEIHPKALGKIHVNTIMAATAMVTPPKWLQLEPNRQKATVVALPAREDIDFDINERLIVELYAR